MSHTIKESTSETWKAKDGTMLLRVVAMADELLHMRIIYKNNV